jgi:hypothetical protein
MSEVNIATVTNNFQAILLIHGKSIQSEQNNIIGVRGLWVTSLYCKPTHTASSVSNICLYARIAKIFPQPHCKELHMQASAQTPTIYKVNFTKDKFDAFITSEQGTPVNYLKLLKQEFYIFIKEQDLIPMHIIEENENMAVVACIINLANGKDPQKIHARLVREGLIEETPEGNIMLESTIIHKGNTLKFFSQPGKVEQFKKKLLLVELGEVANAIEKLPADVKWKYDVKNNSVWLVHPSKTFIEKIQAKLLTLGIAADNLKTRNADGKTILIHSNVDFASVSQFVQRSRSDRHAEAEHKDSSATADTSNTNRMR